VLNALDEILHGVRLLAQMASLSSRGISVGPTETEGVSL
jgi:hypothetical protein